MVGGMAAVFEAADRSCRADSCRADGRAIEERWGSWRSTARAISISAGADERALALMGMAVPGLVSASQATCMPLGVSGGMPIAVCVHRVR